MTKAFVCAMAFLVSFLVLAISFCLLNYFYREDEAESWKYKMDEQSVLRRFREGYGTRAERETDRSLLENEGWSRMNGWPARDVKMGDLGINGNGRTADTERAREEEVEIEVPPPAYVK